MFYILPFIGAILWGAYYAFAGETLKHISVPTWYFLFGVASVLISIIMHKSSAEGVNLAPLMDKKVFWVVLAALLSAKLADIAVTYALIYSSPTFAAFGESIYPIFVPIFVYFLYGQNEMTTQSAVGGVIMVLGLYVFITGYNHPASQTEGPELVVAQQTEDVPHLVPGLVPAAATAPEISKQL